MAAGVIDNFHAYHTVTTLSRRATRRSSAAPVRLRRRSSRTPGNNGGGFFNANLRAPVREPEPVHQTGSRSSCCC